MKTVKTLILAVIILHCIPSSALSQSYDLKGSLREWIKGFTNSPRDIGMLETKAKLELSSAMGEYSALKLKYYYTYDGISKTGTGNLQEAYLDYYSDMVDVRFGKQIITWGKADELNPTDVLNPQDLSSITEEKSIRKTGLLSLRTDWRLKEWELQLVWKLEYDHMKMPDQNSRWGFFRLPGVTELPDPIMPGKQIDDTEWAVKLSRTISMYDFSVSYFDGWDNIFTFVPPPQDYSRSEPDLFFYRTKMYAFDFAGSIGSIGFWGEGAYFRTDYNNINIHLVKNPYIQYVLGADYTFMNGLKVNFQYLQEYITKIDSDDERENQESITSKLGVGIPLQQALSCRLEKPFGSGEAHSMEIFTICDLKNSGFLLQPRLTISPEDAFEIQLGTIIYNGDTESLFGRLGRNDEIYLKCTYSF